MFDVPLHGPVLAVHPTASGFGWAVFDTPDALVDWGLASANQGRKRRQLGQFEWFLRKYSPVALVMEEPRADAQRDPRITRLRRGFARIASSSGAATVKHRREVVHEVLGLSADASRHAVALAVAERLEDLNHRMPRKSTAGRPQDARLSLFAAAALAFTHYALSGVPLPPAHPGASE